MDKEPRLLVWGYTPEEKGALDGVLAELKAPPAFSIEKDQGRVVLRDIVHEGKRSEEILENDEKVLLFYNIPQKGILFLMDMFKKRDLPRPIYAMVTEHSIEWPFDELLEHLVEERDSAAAARKRD